MASLLFCFLFLLVSLHFSFCPRLGFGLNIPTSTSADFDTEFIFEGGGGGMDCIDLSQDRDRWWALLNEVTTFRFHKIRGNFCLAYNRLASLGLRSIDGETE